MKRLGLIFTALIGAVLIQPLSCWGAVHHNIHARLHPGMHTIEVTDTVTLPKLLIDEGNGQVMTLLHRRLVVDKKPLKKLKPKISHEPDLSRFGFEGSSPGEGMVPLQQIILTLKGKGGKFSRGCQPTGDGGCTLKFAYEGPIYHQPESEGEEYDRSFKRSSGIISNDGVVLFGSSFWVPLFKDDLVTFNLTVELPHGWDAVSQGSRTRHETVGNRHVVSWSCPDPMDEVYLIASTFTEYTRSAEGLESMVFFNKPDPDLAAKYLDATEEYISLYSQLIGPYPFGKFALVENFWETGYGMPSFTLLGPRVIRFPFIIHSSYPHEILHNWWGNSVYVDYETGNWCEGLTAYLADHLIKEKRGKGAEYRRDTLQKYLSFVSSSRDFPLNEFRSRHSSATAAVGYGKCLMMFHMLRQRVGDDEFLASLKHFYDNNRFRHASFDDVRDSFEMVTGKRLDWFFRQWVNQAGAPSLKLSEPKVIKKDDKYMLSFSVIQEQSGRPYRLNLPYAVMVDGESKPHMRTYEFFRKQMRIMDGPYLSPPVAVALDPAFDLFRSLDYTEVPPSVGQNFGSEKVLIVLPSQDRDEMKKAYRDLAKEWSKSKQAEVLIEEDKDLDLDRLQGRSVWILGKENFLQNAFFNAVSPYGVSKVDQGLRIEGKTYPMKGNSFVVCARNPMDPKRVITWLVFDPPEALAGLKRKLPHYGKYSYLAFEGTEPKNILKGQWPVTDSPMIALLEGGKAEHANALTALKPAPSLASGAADPATATLMKHVAFLASDRLAGRGLGTPELDMAAKYIASELEKSGVQPGAGGAYLQRWTEEVGEEKKSFKLANVVGVIRGKKPELGPVIIGAHYDHLGRGWPHVHEGDEGKIHNGADDNASGVAVLLGIASAFGSKPPMARSLAFVAFTGEESGLIGSRHFANRLDELGYANPIAMINIDTVGRLDGRDLIALGTGTGDSMEHIVRGAGYVAGASVKTVSDDLGGSDQVCFINKKIPAIQLFAGPHSDYHRPTDDAERIDSAGMLLALNVAKETVAYLGQREEPLAFKGPGEKAPPAPSHGKARRVSLGTIPDFTYTAGGYRLSGVRPESPAHKAGLKEGDIIIKIDAASIQTLRDLSNVLKQHKAGDTIQLTFTRGDAEKTVEVRLEGR
ncbi:M20/M25/M40 family metallo-hydrolase [Acidobacteriota bacterium]